MEIFTLKYKDVRTKNESERPDDNDLNVKMSGLHLHSQIYKLSRDNEDRILVLKNRTVNLPKS